MNDPIENFVELCAHAMRTGKSVRLEGADALAFREAFAENVQKARTGRPLVQKAVLSEMPFSRSSAMRSLDRSLRFALNELAAEYRKAHEDFRRELSAGNKEEVRVKRARRAQRHHELEQLVPYARRLRRQLQRSANNVSCGEVGAPLVAHLLEKFALAENPLPGDHEIWAVRVTGELVANLEKKLVSQRDSIAPTLWRAYQADPELFISLEGRNLGQVRNSLFRRINPVRDVAQVELTEKLSKFNALRDYLRSSLTSESYALLKEFRENL